MKNDFNTYLKITPIFIILFFCGFKTQNTLYPEQIDWESHFLAKPDRLSPYAALTVTNWHYSYTSKISGNNLHIDFKFSGGVVPSQSWVKPDRISARKISRQLLNHEQGHVNINFLLLKEGEIQIRFQKYTVSNYKRLIQANANKIGKYYSDMQDRYDVETKHGSDLEAQARWDDYIRSEMNRYED
ncbi:hypothetical protein EZ428_21855 [Pedobacter frigiditerrae]|uniref:DUF922 domain-containing protein n=1 Tax=Pedobacter frigiditerrae TaxID=2530452 RepID=A0A4R0MMX4_9SPHI|nr:hypothetical protein [Pedobacter frigiditerrae]TCC87344.1 hypothetical protein EZ428_21855 [Pedobacter frigiditerrae]